MRKYSSKDDATINERPDPSMEQGRSMYGLYEGYRPEDVIEIVLPDLGRGIAIGPYDDLWFFTRC